MSAFASYTWPGPERRARRHELAARRDDGDARPARARDVRHAGGRERAELRRAEPDACADDGLTRDDVAAARTDVRSDLDASAISTLFSIWTTCSTGTTASAPSGTTPPVEIAIASPASKDVRPDGAAGGDVLDDGERAGDVGGAHGEAVHRGAGERRQVDEGLRAARP